MQRRMPYRDSAAWTVCKTIYRFGPMTVEIGIGHHRILGPWLCRTKEVYENCVRHGWLEYRDGKYFLVDWVRDRMARDPEQNKPEVVPPREVNVWKGELTGYTKMLMVNYRGRGNK